MKRFSPVTLLLFSLLYCTVSSARDPQTFTFYSSARGRTYTVTTQDVSYSLQFGGHWLYQPSLLLPGAETNNLRVLVFTSNLIANDSSNQAIWVTSDINNTLQFPSPQAVLWMSESSNICDMADARPIWDGEQWHVYVQALLKNTSGVCGTTNSIVQAIGPTLYDLEWDVLPGTQEARVVLAGTPGSAGIGEDQQWYYVPTAPAPFVVTYNDYGNPGGGAEVLTAYSSDGRNMSAWHSTAAVYAALQWQGYSDTYLFPDALLASSLDDASYGPPAIGLASSCYISGSDANKYQYSRVLGYFPAQVSATTLDGMGAGEAVRSISYDSHGERTFRPRLARNSHGFVPLTSSTDTSRTWYTFVMYNPTQITRNSSDGCGNYTRWNSTDQKFAFSTITITEQ